MIVTSPVKLTRMILLSVKNISVIIRLWSVMSGPSIENLLRIQLMEFVSKKENVHIVYV